MRLVLVFASSLLLAACSVGFSPRYYFHSVEISNLSGGAISNLEVRVGERFVRCATLAKNALCHERFGKRPYPQQAIRLSWQDADGNLQVQQTNPTVPLTLPPSKGLRVMLDIASGGSVQAYFKQDGQKL